MLEQTPGLILSNILIILILYTLTRRAYDIGALSPKNRKVSVILAFLFCLFSFWGKDWFGYQAYYIDMQKGHEVSSIEDIYNWLGSICPSYVIFRAVVWGSAFVILLKMIKRLQLNFDVSLFFLCSIFLIWFSYARASLAMSIMYFGFVEILSANRKFSKDYIIGFCLILSSFFFHKSSLFGIAVILITVLLKDSKKLAIIAPILFFPVLLVLLFNNFGGYIDLMLSDETNMAYDYAMVGNNYLTADVNLKGWGETVQQLLERAPYYLLAVCALKVYLSDKNSVPSAIKGMMLVLFLLVLLASVFLFDLGLNTNTIYVRFMRYAQIPALITLTYLHTHNLYPKLTKISVIVALASTVYSLIYTLYNNYVALGGA